MYMFTPFYLVGKGGVEGTVWYSEENEAINDIMS